MEFPKSTAWEESVARAVRQAWRPYKRTKSLVRLTVELGSFESRMVAALTVSLTPVYQAAIIGLLLWMMAEDDEFSAGDEERRSGRNDEFSAVHDQFLRDKAQSEELARKHARDVARGMGETNRDRLREAPTGRTEFRRWVRETLFPDSRAEAVGVTEVTNAISLGEQYAEELLAEAGGDLESFWETANDDLVCPICAPLHNKPLSVYGRFFPSGPPAHVTCRCRKRYRVRKVKRESTANRGTFDPSSAHLRELFRRALLEKFDDDKHPRGPDGKFIGKLSGVDITKWNQSHPSAKWATTLIGSLETYARAGKWDKVEANLWKPGEGKSTNSYQRKLLQAQANILLLKPGGSNAAEDELKRVADATSAARDRARADRLERMQSAKDKKAALDVWKAEFGDSTPSTPTDKGLSKYQSRVLDKHIKANIEDAKERPFVRDAVVSAWRIMSDEVDDHNHALKQVMGASLNWGLISGRIAQGADPSTVPGFDQLVDHAERYYPSLLAHARGESDTGSSEEGLVRAIGTGIREKPDPWDDEVVKMAMSMYSHSGGGGHSHADKVPF